MCTSLTEQTGFQIIFSALNSSLSHLQKQKLHEFLESLSDERPLATIETTYYLCQRKYF